MKNIKTTYALMITLLVLTCGIIGIFWFFFPLIGRTFVEDGGAYNRYYIPFTLWSIGASIPLLISIYNLFKVVINITNDIFFSTENVDRLYRCYRYIFRTDVVCCILMYSCVYIDFSPGIIIMCILLSIVGFIVAQFFKILALWVERGTNLKEELDLTI